MLSLFAYGLTFGQAQAVPEFTQSELIQPEPLSSRAAANMPTLSNEALESESTYCSNSSEQVLKLQQTYHLERRLFF